MKIINIFKVGDSPLAMDAPENELENRVFVIELGDKHYSLTVADKGLKLTEHGVEVFDKQGLNTGHTQELTIFDLEYFELLSDCHQATVMGHPDSPSGDGTRCTKCGKMCGIFKG